MFLWCQLGCSRAVAGGSEICSGSVMIYFPIFGDGVCDGLGVLFLVCSVSI